MGKHSNGHARPVREAAATQAEAPADADLVTVPTDDPPAPAAFSGWLPPPPAGRIQVVTEPVVTAPIASQPSVPAARPAVPAIAEAYAAVASGSWYAAEPTNPGPDEDQAPRPLSALELLATSSPAPAPRPEPLLEPVPDVYERPSQLLATPPQRAVPQPELQPEAEPDLPPVPSFVARASQTTKVPDLVSPAEETRREIARAHRTRKLGKAGGAGVAIAALVAAGVVGLVGYHERPVTHHTTVAPKPVRTQRTLLFALADPAGDEAALLAADPKAGTSSVTLLPSRVVTNVVGQGQVPLGKAVALSNATTAAGSVSDLLGVDVDASWRITPQQLATLVDSLGGITVDVDTQVVRDGVVTIAPGAGQHLGGANAVAYAQYLAPGEDETARLARLQKVLSGILAVLPGDHSRLTAALGALGAASESSQPPGALAVELADVAAGNRTAAVPGPMFSILPVTTLDSGGTTTAYRLDPVAMASYVSQNLAASVPAGAKAGGIRVYVYSGTLEYGLGAAARTKLVNAGLSFVGSANEAAPSSSPSVVLVPDGTDASRAMGQRVAKALGLPASSLQVSTVPQDVADVIVIAGSDFRF